MRRTDSNIWHRVTDLMRSASLLLLSALTVLAVFSCSSGGDEPGTPGTTPGQPEEPGNSDVAILFSASHQHDTDVTRAETPLEEKVQKFTVYGYKNKVGDTYPYQTVFPGYIVNWIEKSANTTTSNTNDWEYVNQQPIGASEQQTIKYWDWESSAYRFFGHTAENAVESTGLTAEAINSNLESGAVVLGNETDEGISYRTLRFKADGSNPDAAPYFSSLWYSTGVYPEPEYGKPVQLTFMRPFVRVRIIIKKSKEDAALLLENMSFKPYEPQQQGEALIITAGTFKVSYPVSGSATQESFSIENPTGIDAFTVEYTDDNPRWYTVIARSQGPYALYIEVNKEPRNIVLSAEYMNWQPGYEYTYVFKITEEGGVEIGTVQTAYTDWEKVEKEHEVHNW